MQVKLTRKTAPFHFEATNERQMIVEMDSSAQLGGENRGVSPMEMVLMGLGGCASIDLGLILNKQKQVLDDCQLEITGERDDTPAKAFKEIHIHFILKGTLDEKKVNKALELTLTKYCSVAMSLKESIEVNYSFEIES